MWVLGSLQPLTQELVPRLSTCRLAAEGSVRQLLMVQSLTNENWTLQAHLVGIALIFQCLNTLQNLRNGDGFFSAGREAPVVALSHMHAYTHTRTQRLLFLFLPTFLLQKTSNTL